MMAFLEEKVLPITMKVVVSGIILDAIYFSWKEEVLEEARGSS